MMHGNEKSELRHSSCEADEQSRATGGGAGGAKGGDQREAALLQRCWRVGILREFGAKGFRFSCWERIMPFKILWGGG